MSSASPSTPPGRRYEYVQENPGERPNDYHDDSSSSSEDDDDDSDSDSDSDFGKKALHKVEVSVKDQLTEVLNEMKDHGKSFEDFGLEVKNRLAMKTGNGREPTALHILAVAKKDDLPIAKDLKPLIEFLVKRPERLLAETDDEAKLTPLHLAISEKNRTMVRWMCQAYNGIDGVLSMKSQKQRNCLHMAVETKRSKIAKSLVDLASADTLSAKDLDGNTPLHLAVECQKCDDKQLELIKAIVQKCDHRMRVDDNDFNEAGRSPYLHHLHTCDQAQKLKERDKKDEEMKRIREDHKASRSGRPLAERDWRQKGLEVDPSQPPTESFTKEDDLPFYQPVQRSNSRTDEPLQPKSSIRLPKQWTEMHSKRQRRMMPFAQSSDESLAHPLMVEPKDEKNTTHKSNAATKDTGEQISSYNSQSSFVEEIREFLKLHYLRTRSHDAALEILYGRYPTSGNLDKAIFLDVSGCSTKHGIYKAISILKFEDVLQYVKIPRVSIEEPKTVANTAKTYGRASKPDGNGRTDLVEVFERLKGVTTILKVTVDDLKSPSHTDEAIERILRGKNVEIWDWKKIDLCSEVIYNVAPEVTEVHLYWSGNNAVLRGWSEEDGLPKLKQLQRIELHMEDQGLETLTRVKANVADFRRRIGEQLRRQSRTIEESMQGANGESAKGSSKVTADETARRTRQIEIIPHYPEKPRETIYHDLNPGGITSSDVPRRHDWIECMRDFKQLLFTAEANSEFREARKAGSREVNRPIVVALIDDGFDIEELELGNYGEIHGRSFYFSPPDAKTPIPHYESSGGHGTVTASQIRRICPKAELLVLKLEDYTDPESKKRQITSKSAAQAIRQAVMANADIISMSWTITEQTDHRQSEGFTELKNAISEAARANILMFCSASDQGAKQSHTYPSKATNLIFKIGGADAIGDLYKPVGDDEAIDFILPGKLVEGEGLSDAAINKVQYWTGSSVATALAAGLAALILYCAQIRIIRSKGPVEVKKATEKFKALRQHENMMDAFREIGMTKKKYLKVWDVFGKKVDAANNAAYDVGEKIDLVAEVATTLCAKF